MIDPSNLESVKKFFADNPYRTTYELAILAGRSPSTIRNWKRKCGVDLKESPFKGKREYKSRDVEKITDCHIWDNEEWFRQKYEQEGLGIPTIARMIGRSVSLVAGRLVKYEIATRSHADAVKSSNPYCNEEWLYTNYATRRQYIDWCIEKKKTPSDDGGKSFPLAKCAEMANVVPYTIYNWLVHYKIPMRDISEAMSGEHNPFYGKKHSDETKTKIREAYYKAQDGGANPEPPATESGDQGGNEPPENPPASL